MSCNYCTKNEENIVNRLPREVSEVTAYIRYSKKENPQLIVKDKDGQAIGIFPISHCPMCGQKL